MYQAKVALANCQLLRYEHLCFTLQFAKDLIDSIWLLFRDVYL